MVGLTGFEGHYPKSLSGGMRMRCSLARTLTLRPPVFLFDEPFGAVDEITREHLNEQTLELFQAEGFAGLFITHSISRGRLHEHAGARDVAAAGPDRRRVRGAVRATRGRPSCASSPDFALLSGDSLQGPAGRPR